MTSPNLISDLHRDEGLRLEAYPDPLSHGPPWTIGYGHTGLDVHEGLVWTKAQADAALAHDVAAAIHALDEDTTAGWWRTLSDLRQDCFVNMVFNMGMHRFSQFNTFLSLCKAGKLTQAALDLRGTLWFKQVGVRADRIARQFGTNQHQG